MKHGLYEFYFVGGGEVPRALSGMYTRKATLLAAVQSYKQAS